MKEPPLPVRKFTFTQEPTNSANESAPYAVRVVIQTNAQIQPTSLVVQCDSDVQEGQFYMVGVSAYRDSGNGRVGNSSGNFWFFFGDPPIRPDRPIVVILAAKEPIQVTAVVEGSPR